MSAVNLSGPLVRYRSAVAELRSQGLESYSPSRNEIIDLVWRQRVAPALLEIEDDLRHHGLVRELARSLGADVRDVVKGLPLRSTLGVIAGSVAQIDATIEVAAAAVIGFLPPVIGAQIEAPRREARDRTARLLLPPPTEPSSTLTLHSAVRFTRCGRPLAGGRRAVPLAGARSRREP